MGSNPPPDRKAGHPYAVDILVLQLPGRAGWRLTLFVGGANGSISCRRGRCAVRGSRPKQPRKVVPGVLSFDRTVNLVHVRNRILRIGQDHPRPLNRESERLQPGLCPRLPLPQDSFACQNNLPRSWPEQKKRSLDEISGPRRKRECLLKVP